MSGHEEHDAQRSSVPSQSDGTKYVRDFPSEDVDVESLTLDEVRARRKALTARECHVSYWRRIIQARLDLLEQGVVKHGASGEGLKRVLAQRMGVNNRLGILSVQPQGAQPLSGLDHLWHRSITADETDLAELDADLHDAERELSQYRSELHQQIDAATAELIRRYRDNPTLVASVLPQRESRPIPL